MKARLVVILLLGTIGLSPVSSFATGCTAAMCSGAKVEWIRIWEDGKIWFVVDNSDQLASLAPSPACTLKNVWTGASEPALFIAADDPAYSEKYKMLLISQASGTELGFTPAVDSATGWCKVARLTLGAS